MRTAFIYGLRCPLTGLIRYIGKCDDPKTRLLAHLRDPEKNRRTNWLASLKSQGLKPALEIVAEVAHNNWEFWERSYIRAYRCLGFDLANSTDGGEGVTMTPEIRAKIGARSTGRRPSLEVRAKMSASRTGEKNPMFGKIFSPSMRERMSAAQKGKKPSLATREKMSAAHRGEKNHNFGKTGRLHPGFGKKPRRNTSGFLGVNYHAKKWMVRFQGKYLGSFSKIEDAVFVRALAFDKYYGN